MKTPVRAASLGALLMALPPTAWAPTPKQLFATVVTNTGAPVTDLQPAEFDVRENSVKLTVSDRRRPR